MDVGSVMEQMEWVFGGRGAEAGGDGLVGG